MPLILSYIDFKSLSVLLCALLIALITQVTLLYFTNIKLVISDGNSNNNNNNNNSEPCSGFNSISLTQEGLPHYTLPTLNLVVSKSLFLDLCNFIDLKAIKTISFTTLVHT